jgi:hypothetical protein
MTPELRLITACCRWPADSARERAIGTEVELRLDWGRVEQLARFHRVEGLVTHGLQNFVHIIPRASMERLERTAGTIKANATRDLGETLRLERTLTNAGIEHRFLKGLALGITVYGTPTLKHSWDIDVLVDPSDAVDAARCLESLEYEPRVPARSLDAEEFARWSRVSKEAEFQSRRGTSIELHWQVTDNKHLLPDVTANGPGRVVQVLGEHEVLTLDDAQNLAYLAVHGFSHAWFRLKWIADFNAFANSFDEHQLGALCAAATEMGVGDSLETAFELTGALFAGRTPFDPARSRENAAMCMRALNSGDEAEAQRIAARLRWRTDPSWKYRLTELGIRATGTLDRLDYPLPSRFHFLYPWLRLPFWLHRTALKRKRARP